MTRLLFIGLVCLLLCSINVYGQNEEVHSKIDAIAKEYTNQKKTRALAIVYFDDGIAYQKFYGETQKENSTPPNTQSIFEIGAVTSVFTTTLLAQLEFNQALSTDDELRKFLPNDVVIPFYQNIICVPDKEIVGVTDDPDSKPVKVTPYICVPDANSPPEEIKLCYLASHTAGLPYLPSNMGKKNKKDPYADYSKNDLYSYLKKYKLKHALGIDYKYSITGIALLGHALELYQKKSMEELYNEIIWSPLKMKNTSLALDSRYDHKVMRGHSKKGKSTSLYHYNAMAPYSGIRSTPNDMQLFLEANLNINESTLSNAVILAQQGRLKIKKKKLADTEIALGWYVTSIQNDKKIIWQKGNTAGFSCFIGMLKGQKSGIVIMANNNTNLDTMAMEILNLLK